VRVSVGGELRWHQTYKAIVAADFAPGVHFAPAVHDDKVKQCGATYDYLLQHGADVDIANATCHRANYGKT